MALWWQSKEVNERGKDRLVVGLSHLSHCRALFGKGVRLAL